MAENAGSTPLEVVRTFTAAMRSGDLDTCRSLITEDLVFSEAPGLPFGGDWVGPDGFLAFLGAVSKHYRVRLGDLDIEPAGERVVVRVNGTIASRVTGRSLPLDAVDVYEFRSGRIARVDVYYKDSGAVAALCEPELDGSAVEAEKVAP